MLKWLGTVPWLVLLIGMPLLNHVEPFVLGLPLALFFAIVCTLFSALVLALVFCLDPRNRAQDRQS